MPLFGIYFDPLYIILTLPAILLAMWAQARVQTTVAAWSRVRASRGMTGADAAAEVLRGAGIDDVKIERVDGFLSDHYDPRSKTLRLSSGNFEGQSVAAFGIAAHEAGHAIQHASGYAPLTIRSSVVPLASIGSWLAWPVLMIGVFIVVSSQHVGTFGPLLIQGGIALFALTVFFQLITLPVEIDASRRAIAMLSSRGLLTGEEGEGARKVLRAAAWTYVAAAAMALVQLLYMILRYGSLASGGNRRD